MQIVNPYQNGHIYSPINRCIEFIHDCEELLWFSILKRRNLQLLRI